MKRLLISRWGLLVALNVLFCCVLSFHQTSSAQQRGTQEPFANSVRQRQEMINELVEIKALLKEQNELLRAGQVRVIIEADNRSQP